MVKRRAKKANWWQGLEMKYKVLTAALGFLILFASSVQAYIYLGLPIMATRDWVIEAQYPILQQGARLEIGQKQQRISAIKDLLVGIADKKPKATPSEKVRFELQEKDLNEEWAKLVKEIQSMESTKR